ncbi:MAG: hypothetical protein ABI868_06465 [Acidobacteriota bacterium]
MDFDHLASAVRLTTTIAAVVVGSAAVAGQGAQAPGSAPRAGVKLDARKWSPPRTPWGDPDLQGAYTNKDENGIPMERPNQFQGKTIDQVEASELAAIVRQRQQNATEIAPGIGGAETGAGPVHWYEYYGARNSRPWMIVDPADGRIPSLTPEAQQRAAAVSAGREGRGEADSPDDRSLYDRCITRGVPGSMMPAIYGNSYQMVQAPGVVAIRYEMIHETRLIPLDGRPHVDQGIRLYMGDARGRWEGNTLVVETTNFNGRMATDIVGYGSPDRGASQQLRIVERFTPSGPTSLDWSVQLDDPHTWTRPWTFTMTLTKDDTQPVYEYACHEGNYGLSNILSAARAEEKGQ